MSKKSEARQTELREIVTNQRGDFTGQCLPTKANQSSAHLYLALSSPRVAVEVNGLTLAVFGANDDVSWPLCISTKASWDYEFLTHDDGWRADTCE